MKLAFTATEFGTTDDGYTLLCGASNSKSAEGVDYRYITLQRSSDPEDEDDWGIHFEIDDQINGGYELLGACALESTKLTCHLTKGTDWYPDLRVVEVLLGESPAEFSSLSEGLIKMFRDRSQDLILVSP
jgi:hypothetical protein